MYFVYVWSETLRSFLTFNHANMTMKEKSQLYAMIYVEHS